MNKLGASFLGVAYLSAACMTVYAMVLGVQLAINLVLRLVA